MTTVNCRISYKHLSVVKNSEFDDGEWEKLLHINISSIDSPVWRNSYFKELNEWIPAQVWGWIVIGGVLSFNVILDNQTIYLIKQENNIQWDSSGKINSRYI